MTCAKPGKYILPEAVTKRTLTRLAFFCYRFNAQLDVITKAADERFHAWFRFYSTLSFLSVFGVKNNLPL